MKMKAICSFETSLDFHRTTQRYVREDRTLHSHSCNDLRLRVFENRVLRGIFGLKRGRNWQEAGENYLMTSFVICRDSVPKCSW
jgi:hypothetical protein